MDNENSSPFWFVEKYIDKMDWFMLSRNTSMTPEFFEKYIDRINWYEISQNPSIINRPIYIKKATN